MKRWLRKNELSLWTRIRLFFRPTQVSVDIGKKDDFMLFFKELDGNIYITREDWCVKEEIKKD